MDDPGLELLSPAFSVDPYPAFRRIRQTGPVVWSAALQRWIITGYEACREALRSPDIGVGRDRYLAEVLSNVGPGRGYDYVSGRLLTYDPPEHHRLRATVQGAFTAHHLNRLRGYIGELAGDLLASAAAEEGPVDLLARVAHPLPSLVIGELLGLPDDDRAAFDGWTAAIAPLIGPRPSAEEVAAGNAAAEAEWAFLTGWIAGRRTDRRDDVVSLLVEAEEAGRITEDELVATIVFLFSAGHQTTRDLLGNGLHALFRHRDQWELLCRQPELIPAAVTEMLRFDTSVTATVRGVARDTTIAGVELPAGSGVVVALAAANRDPERFAEPDRFQVQRPDNHPLSFGGGAHHCLGAALARMEAEAVLDRLVSDHPSVTPAYEALAYRPGLAFRGPLSLPVFLS